MSYKDVSVLGSQSLEDLKKAIRFKHWNVTQPPSIEKQFQNKLSYIQNEFGFRDKDILFDVDICYYGCSVTYGAGVPLESRYTNLIDEKKAFISNNFGINGAGLDDICQLFISTSNFIKTKKAFILIPDSLRWVVPIGDRVEDTIYKFAFVNYDKVYSDQSSLYRLSKEIFSLPVSIHDERMRVSLEIIVTWAKHKNIDLYVGTWSPSTHTLINSLSIPNLKFIDSQFDLDGQAYDGSHPGEEAHKRYAESLIEIIN